jgi:hypothetical protein
MRQTKMLMRRALRTLALLGQLGAGGAWAQSCASLAATVNATSPGLDQRLRENAQIFDTDFLRERIARAKLTAREVPAQALTVCVFEQELATRSGANTAAASQAAAPARDDPKVFGRSARGG